MLIENLNLDYTN